MIKTYTVSVDLAQMAPQRGDGHIEISFGAAPENIDKMTARLMQEVERFKRTYARRRWRMNGMFVLWFFGGGGMVLLVHGHESLWGIPRDAVNVVYLVLWLAFTTTWIVSCRCPACSKFLWFPVLPPCPRCGIPLR